jgi:hypothetical protein
MFSRPACCSLPAWRFRPGASTSSVFRSAAQKDTQRTAAPSSEIRTFAGIVAAKGALLRGGADQKIYKILNRETLRRLEGQ